MHSIVLCSDWNRKEFPNNHGGEFTNILPQNVNFSLDNASTAISSIVYTPDSWMNVRDTTNDVTVRMSGFHVWGRVTKDVYIQSRKIETRMQDNRHMAQYRYYRCTRLNDDCHHYRQMKSVWMDVEKGKENDMMMAPKFPFSKEITYEFEKWTQNKYNPNKFKAIMMGPVKTLEDFKETFRVPPKQYDSIDEFILEFNKGLSMAVDKILKKSFSHNIPRNLPELPFIEMVSYELSIIQRSYKADTYYAQMFQTQHSNWNVNTEFFKQGGLTHGDSTVGAWIEPWQAFNNIRYWSNMATDDFQDKVDRGTYKRESGSFLGTLARRKLSYSENPSWIQLTLYNPDPNDDSGKDYVSLIVAKEFLKETNISVHMNRNMQYQLGFTVNPIIDMGWSEWLEPNEDLQWYKEVKNKDKVKIPLMTSYATLPYTLSNNPIQSLCVHCDIIEGTYVGSKKVPLLKIFPVNVFTHLVSSELFHSLQYKHVNKNNVSSITIKITEKPDSDALYLRAPVYVKLSFIYG